MSGTFEEGVRSRLLADPAITDHIERRIFPLFLPPDKARPAIIYETNGADRGDDQSGGLVQIFFVFKIQVDGLDYGTARIIFEALRKNLQRFKGKTPDGFELRGVFFDDETSDHVPPSDGRGVGYVTYTVDVQINYRETALRCF